MVPTPPLLDVSRLTVEYTLGSRVSRVLDGVSFAARDGQLALALGPSGCGKTTLLSVLAGLLHPTRGRVRFADIDVGSLVGHDLLDYRRRTVGVVFQAFNLVSSLSAVENVMAPLVLTGVRSREARAVAMRRMDELAMGPHARKRPGQLSGGQQQRVAFARAMVHDPPLLVADEPTAHLDPEQAESMLGIIDGLRAPGRLVVVATHDARFYPLADTVVQMGTDVVARPASRAS